MSSNEFKGFNFNSILKWVIAVSCLLHFAKAQDVSDYNQFDNPEVRPLIKQLVYSMLSNITAVLDQKLGNTARFCIKDPEVDWDKAFNFTSDMDFLSSCIRKTEAGMGCSVGPDQHVDLQISRDFPARTQYCQPCCEGFFCPRGITCMIPCPLGSYCPQATLNEATGICEPYTYHLPPGQPNHTCGGANIWADVRSSREVFCSAGSYCPTTTQKVNCSSGHYCRMGSTSEKPCFKLTSCDYNTANQSMHALGVMVISAISTILLIIYNCSDQILITRERRLAKSREAAARACQRWKAAKEDAMKHASEVHAQISRTFSHKKSIQHDEKHRMLDNAESQVDEDFYLPTYSTASNASPQPSREIEDVVESHEKHISKHETRMLGSHNYTQDCTYAPFTHLFPLRGPTKIFPISVP